MRQSKYIFISPLEQSILKTFFLWLLVNGANLILKFAALVVKVYFELHQVQIKPITG